MLPVLTVAQYSKGCEGPCGSSCCAQAMPENRAAMLKFAHVGAVRRRGAMAGNLVMLRVGLRGCASRCGL
jgi:hypothetical protein